MFIISALNKMFAAIKAKLTPKILTILALAGLLLATGHTYMSCLFNELVDWDDQFQITQNMDIKVLNWQNLHKMFTSFYLGMYQPLATLSFAVENKFWHAWPLMLHLDSLLLHCLNILLVYWLTVRLFKKRMIALLTAAFFALYPLQVESVAWVSARSNLLASLFFLSALIAYTSYLKKFSWKNYFITLFLCLLALLSKVPAVSLPLVLLLFDYYHRRPNSKKLWLEKIPFFALSIIFGLVAIQSRGVNELLPNIAYAWWHKVLFISHAFIFYLEKLILPIRQSAYYGFPPLTNGWLPLNYYWEALIFLILAYAVWHWRRQRNLVFLTLFYCLLIGPTLQIKTFSTTITADRYVYLAGLAYFWFLSLAIVFIWQRYEKFRKLLIIVVLLFLMLLAGLTKIRTWVWSDSLSLWTDILKQDPQTANVYNAMGNALNKEADFDTALIYYKKALALDPKNSFTYNNIGTALFKNKDYLAAANYFNQAIALNSHEALPYYNRGNVWLQLGKFKEALADYQLAIKLNTGDSNYTYLYLGSLARAQYENNLLTEAVDTYNQAIIIYSLPDAYFYRGLAKIKLKQTANGCQDLAQADKLAYRDAVAQINKFCHN